MFLGYACLQGKYIYIAHFIHHTVVASKKCFNFKYFIHLLLNTSNIFKFKSAINIINLM